MCPKKIRTRDVKADPINLMKYNGDMACVFQSPFNGVQNVITR